MEHLVKILKNADPKNVVVIGDLMLDEYVTGSVERISPEAPVPVLKESGSECSFGGATNVAINCRRVGCNVYMLGVVGKDDHAGRTLLSMLADKGVYIEGVVASPDRVTTRKKRIVSMHQQLLRIDSEQTHELSLFERERLICNIHTIIKPGSIVLLSDYAKGVIDRQIVEEAVARAQVCGAIVIADPKGPDFDKYHGVSYIKPNLKEFFQMVEFFGLSRLESIEENGLKICEKLSLDGIIVTRGEDGISFVSKTEKFSCEACKREVYDITGAGDTVLAFLSVGLVNGFSIKQSLKLANTAASVAVSHRKTYAVGLDELLDESGESKDKIYSNWHALKEELEWLRCERNCKIVFTNGCFDLLHSGHLFVLREAKKRGDILVVAINTDASVKRYKGECRPIKTLDERAGIMAAIDVVDYVVSFDQDTPYKLIDILRPDVLVKGGDYKLESIVGYDLVTSYGGRVYVVEYKNGFSTTNLVTSVKESSA